MMIDCVVVVVTKRAGLTWRKSVTVDSFGAATFSVTFASNAKNSTSATDLMVSLGRQRMQAYTNWEMACPPICILQKYYDENDEPPDVYAILESLSNIFVSVVISVSIFEFQPETQLWRNLYGRLLRTVTRAKLNSRPKGRNRRKDEFESCRIENLWTLLITHHSSSLYIYIYSTAIT